MLFTSSNLFALFWFRHWRQALQLHPLRLACHFGLENTNFGDGPMTNRLLVEEIRDVDGNGGGLAQNKGER